MPEATGSVDGTAGDSITATFVVGDATYTYTGIPTPSIEPFSSTSVTLSYNTIEDLDGTHPFTCFIHQEAEPNYTVVIIDNGTRMLGGLDSPASSSSDTSGTGTWSH